MFRILNRLFSQSAPYVFEFPKAKRNCRILLIDDDPDALPIDDLKSDEYNIEQRKKVDAGLLRNCESAVYDLIVLDYNGVAPASICPDDGFGVFERIRKSNPDQYIISISAQTYDISKTEYFKKANAYLKKPTDLVTTKKALDEGIEQLFHREFIFDRISNALTANGIPKKRAERLIQSLRSEDIKSYSQVESIAQNILKTSEDIDKIRTWLTRLGKIISI